jgi:protein-S-isoprenylcysteine O-methyltransferase Ste14
MNAIYLGLLWLVYYFIHSALATNSIKLFFKSKIPAVYPYYRLMYSVFAVINFALLLLLHIITPSRHLFSPRPYFILPAAVFIALGVWVTMMAVKGYGYDFFYKDKQAERSERKLNTSGMNAIVRHPLYFGLILMLAGVFVIAPNWKNVIFILVTIIYSVIGALIEEQKLIEMYGDEYLKYKKKVKMLIPYLI